MPLRFLVAALATSLALTASAVVAPRQAQAATPLNIRIGWVVMSGDMAPLVFEKPDILKDYGKTYTVEPIHFKGTSPQITALAAGQLDIASLAYSSFGLAIDNARLSDLRVVADGFQDGHPGYASIPYMVRNHGGVTKIGDLKGKTMGVNVIGAAVDIGGRATVLARNELSIPATIPSSRRRSPRSARCCSKGRWLSRRFHRRSRTRRMSRRARTRSSP